MSLAGSEISPGRLLALLNRARLRLKRAARHGFPRAGVWLLATLVFGAITGSAQGKTTYELVQRSIEHEGLSRTFLLYVPPRFSLPLPVVVVFHGGGGSADGIANKTEMHKVAEREGFVVVYPNGINGRWNSGDQFPGSADDIGFITKALVRLRNEGVVDPTRIFATGLSRGGMFAYHLACNKNYLAAIAPVAATLTSQGCAPNPKSVFHIHGVDDENVPWQGGAGLQTA